MARFPLVTGMFFAPPAKAGNVGGMVLSCLPRNLWKLGICAAFLFHAPVNDGQDVKQTVLFLHSILPPNTGDILFANCAALKVLKYELKDLVGSIQTPLQFEAVD